MALKSCVIVVSNHFLKELLQLPRGARITGIQDDIYANGRILLRIEGAGFETSPGLILQRVTATATTKTYTDLKWPFDEQADA